MKSYNVGILGATGAVGSQVIKILEQSSLPVKNIKLLASERSAGAELTFSGRTVAVQAATPASFQGLDLAIFSAGTEISRQMAPEAVKRGVVVIDNSNAFRMDRDVPLVVPEVNPEDVKKHNGIVANPNCSTIQMVVALKPLHDYGKIRRVVVSTYQAVSGTGLEAMTELSEQTKNILENKNIVPSVYPHRIGFNLLPHIDVFDENGDSREELKMVNETKKIMGDETIKVTATTVRVPVYVGHSEAINVETEVKITREKAWELFKSAPGIILVDNPAKNEYPMPVDAVGKNEVFVGRVREDNTIQNGINMWVVADNLRKGAAYNAVQVAELLPKYKLL
jgi:aspartate-semialdehyde dehydrogenase